MTTTTTDTALTCTSCKRGRIVQLSGDLWACDCCGWKYRVDENGIPTDMLDWTRAGRKLARRHRRFRRR